MLKCHIRTLNEFKKKKKKLQESLNIACLNKGFNREKKEYKVKIE